MTLLVTLPAMAEYTVLEDEFTHKASDITNERPHKGDHVWKTFFTDPAVISSDGTKAVISVNKGAVGSGTAMANFSFVVADNTLYTLTVTFLHNGVVGGVDCWGGMGFYCNSDDNINTAPWVILRPQADATSSVSVTGIANKKPVGVEQLPASMFTASPTPVTVVVTWNTKTGEAKYAVNGTTETAWTTNNPIPNGDVRVFFQGFHTGNKVDVKSISLISKKVE